jgi:hypothetical protein
MGDFKFEAWPTEFRVITQHFGVNPRNYAQFGLPGHDGIDIRAPTGSKVFCVAPGEVFRIHHSPKGHNYGIHVRVAHRDGYKTVYAHLQKVMVREGQIVEAGTVLGLADNTGNSFGPHLHITLKREGAIQGKWPYNIIDPTPYLLPLLGWKEPAGPYVEGWALGDALTVRGKLGQVSTGGATLYINPSLKKTIPAGTIIIVDKRQSPFARVRVSQAAVGLKDTTPPQPAPEPPPLVATIDGWAPKYFLTVLGKQAIVGPHGINLRAGAARTTANIGMVRAGSTVSVIGMPKERYLPVRVRRNDFMEPVSHPDPPPKPGAFPSENSYAGWALTQYLSPIGGQHALASSQGVNLRNRPDEQGQNIGLIKAYATVTLSGPERNDYSPVLIRRDDVLNAVDPMPAVELPDRASGDEPRPPEPQPNPDTTPGWAFSNGLLIAGEKAKVAQYGSNLRDAPRRDAKKIGFIPAGTSIIVTGRPQGEYTPVRVREDLLKPPTSDDDDPDPDSRPLALARIGLHASADPDIGDAEHKEFAQLRPGIIKVLSFHSAEDISRLAAAHPEAHWIVRAFLSFGERQITPTKFLEDTIGDVRRALSRLRGRNFAVELHNEPNVVAEGLGKSWSDGTAFNAWWLELLGRYRRALPGVRFIYPGLSPGSTVIGTKQDHIQFIEASREAVEAANGLGAHIYWSNTYSMQQALGVLDDYITRFRAKPIWITEASHNQGVVTPLQIAKEYLRFWSELQSRPVVKGVTYFVASASDPDFAGEVWVGKGIGSLIGRR